jgi:hypothetical protein
MYKLISLHILDDKMKFFNELPRKNELENQPIQLSSLRLLAEHGSHEVFEDPSQSGFVFKVFKISKGRDLDELSSNASEIAKNYSYLYDAFEEHAMQEVHLPATLLYPGGSIITAKVSVQAFDSCFEAEDKFEFKTRYTEKNVHERRENSSLYQYFNKIGLQRGAAVPIDVLNFIPEIYSLVKEAQRDNSLKTCLKDFLNRFRTFYNNTGTFIDLSGKENVLFYKKDGAWDYKVGSVLKGENKELLNESINLFLEDGTKYTQERLRLVLENALPWVRALNCCAAFLGIRPIIIDINFSDTLLCKLDNYEDTCKELSIVYDAKKGDFKRVFQNYNEYKELNSTQGSETRLQIVKRYWEYVSGLKNEGAKANYIQYLEPVKSLISDPRTSDYMIDRVQARAAIEGILKLRVS